MLDLLFFPIHLAIEFALLPLRLTVSLIRSGWLLAIGVIMGLLSLVMGLVRGMLPLVLIGVGLFMIATAYKSAKARRDGTDASEEEIPLTSYFTKGSVR